MFQKKYSIYLGTESEETFNSFIVEENLILIIKIDSGISKDNGREILRDISDSVKAHKIQSLDDFENFLSSKWKEHNLPTEFSYSAGYLYRDSLFLKTNQNGQIFIKKDNNFAKIIESENRASGKINSGDFLVFTTNEFTKIAGGEEIVGKIFDHKSPQEILEDITPKLKGEIDQGTIALFLTLEKISEDNVLIEKDNQIESQTEIPKSNMLIDKVIQIKDFLYSKLNGKFSKKPVTILIVIIVAFFLIWSLISGYNRNSIKAAELIREKLKQADDVSDLNLSRSIILLTDAEKDLSTLKKKLNNNSKTVKDLEDLIKDYESKILKSEEKGFSEFYDVSLENKNANIQQIYKNEDTIVVLDKYQQAYIISLSKKSIDSRKSSNLKDVISIAYFQDDIYFLKKDGVYRLTVDDKTKKLIESDNWGQIKDMSLFLGNIYLLDIKKSDIYKYISADDEYSGKTSYFVKGQGINLEGSNSIAIDGSLFIGFEESIVKFTSGLRDGFSTSYPNEKLNFTKIFTDENIDKIFAWSKPDGIIYVLSKTGSYESQIKSSILKKAVDFVVYEKAIYAVYGSKIYTIKL